MLTESQMSDYRRDGFLVLRGAVPEADIVRLEAGLERNPPLDGTLDNASRYPEPGRYTLALNSLKDPDLGFIVEHPTITGAAADLLGDDPRLTAFVLYDRTPGGPGIPAHNDYKRWRPVGSSMNWLFTIIPFCDYDSAAGQLFVAPGSHHLERVHPGPERPLCIDPPVVPSDDDFVDPELKRGDLLVMNMHLWHKAAPNTSEHHRAGAFNKYAAASAPPATGYFLYDDDVHDVLSPEGRSVLAVHSDKPLGTTRLVLMREHDDDTQILMVDDGDGNWSLPGGPTWVEQAIPDWDRGNVIASLQGNLRDRIRIETPWVSYIGDYDEGDHLCRVYGYTLTGRGFPVAYEGAEWVGPAQVEAGGAERGFGYEHDAYQAWLDPEPVRGKGLTQAQSRVDQYAY